MSEHSRRTFLRGAGVSAAAVTVAAVLPSGIASAATTDGTESSAPATTKPVVAYVTDPSAGKITVLHGEKEIVVTDKGLARRIAKLAP
jgi:hypothetical protein